MCILDLHLSESHTLCGALKHLALFAKECYLQGIEVGGFRRPLGRVFHIPLCRHPTIGGHGEGFLLHGATFGIGQTKFCTLALGIRRRKHDVERSITICRIEVGSEEDVIDMRNGTGIEVALTCNSSKAPEVLVLEIRTVAPAHHLHGNEVLLSGLDVAREVELSGVLGIFGISYPLAVDPDLHIRGGGTDVHDYLLAIPRCRNVEGTAVGTCIVVLLLYIRRVVLELCGPGVAYILVDRLAITVKFEESGYGEFFPFAVVISHSLKALWTEIVVTGEMELPFSFERKVACRKFLIVRQSFFGTFEGEERSMRGHNRPYAVLVGIEPIFLGGICIVAGLRRCRVRCKSGGQHKGRDEYRFHDTMNWLQKCPFFNGQRDDA